MFGIEKSHLETIWGFGLGIKGCHKNPMQSPISLQSISCGAEAKLVFLGLRLGILGLIGFGVDCLSPGLEF